MTTITLMGTMCLALETIAFVLTILGFGIPAMITCVLGVLIAVFDIVLIFFCWLIQLIIRIVKGGIFK